MRNGFCGFVIALLATSAATRAGDLFQVSATGGGQTVNAGGSNVIDLASDAAGSKNEFSSLGSNFNADLKYAGINNAVVLNQSTDSAGHKILNLKVPSTGLNKTFSSANGDLGDQIKDYLKKDGLAALTQFQRVAGQKSIAGTVDGQPAGSDGVARRFGLLTIRTCTARHSNSTAAGTTWRPGKAKRASGPTAVCCGPTG